jgi:heme/copper-type cytochrome/quinol oxidase subunit 2
MKKITIAIIIFLFIGAYSIVRQNDLDVKDNQEDRVSFVKKFSGWIFNIGKNVKDLTGEATKQEWLPQEQNDNDTIK